MTVTPAALASWIARAPTELLPPQITMIELLAIGDKVGSVMPRLSDWKRAEAAVEMASGRTTAELKSSVSGILATNLELTAG